MDRDIVNIGDWTMCGVSIWSNNIANLGKDYTCQTAKPSRLASKKYRPTHTLVCKVFCTPLIIRD